MKSGWPIVAFIAGLVVSMLIMVDIDSERVERGTFYHNGKLYQLVEITPAE